jgi:hypothetical protein
MRKAVMLGMAAAIAAAGCSKAHSEGAGAAGERNYPVANFDRIELAGPYDAVVRIGGAPSVHAKGDERMLERLVVEVKDGRLQIHPRQSHRIGWPSSRGKVALAITVPSLRGADIAGSGDIRIDRVVGDGFEGGIAGSGDLRVERIEVGTLKLSIAGSGGVHALSGRATQARYEIAGSGAIDAKGVQTETAAVSIAGSGGVNAHAAKTAAISIMGSGDANVTGGAKCTVSKAGSGQARCS